MLSYSILNFRSAIRANNSLQWSRRPEWRRIHACVNSDAVYFEAGPLNQTICIAPLATPPLNFLKLVTNSLAICARPCTCAWHYNMHIHTHTINNDIICSVNVTFSPFLSWLPSADVSSNEQWSGFLLCNLVTKRYHTLHLDTFLVYWVPSRVDHLPGVVLVVLGALWREHLH